MRDIKLKLLMQYRLIILETNWERKTVVESNTKIQKNSKSYQII
jgi:hypothetical protein